MPLALFLATALFHAQALSGDVSGSRRHFEGTDPSGKTRARVGACVAPEGLRQVVDALQAQALALLTEQVGAIETTVAQAQLEAATLDELRQAEQEGVAQRAVCEREAREAQRDLATYQRELAELAAIARADVQVYDWAPVALLGARSVSAPSARVADVQRAAEHHFGLVRAAKRAAACQKLAGHATRRPISRVLPRAGGHDVELFQEGERQVPEAPIAADPLGQPADPAVCRAEQDRLRESYVEAYVRMKSLVELAEAAADERSCLEVAGDLLAERRVPLLRELSRVRQQLCSAHQAAEKAGAAADQLRSNLDTARSALAAENCAESTWRRYEGVLAMLLEVGNGRPVCSQCCWFANTTNVTGEVLHKKEVERRAESAPGNWTRTAHVLPNSTNHTNARKEVNITGKLPHLKEVRKLPKSAPGGWNRTTHVLPNLTNSTHNRKAINVDGKMPR